MLSPEDWCNDGKRGERYRSQSPSSVIVVGPSSEEGQPVGSADEGPGLPLGQEEQERELIYAFLSGSLGPLSYRTHCLDPKFWE